MGVGDNVEFGGRRLGCCGGLAGDECGFGGVLRIGELQHVLISGSVDVVHGKEWEGVLGG